MNREQWAKLPVGIRLSATRLYANQVQFWMSTVRPAFPAFLCGVIAGHESIWWTFGVCVVLFLIERYAFLMLLEVPVSVVMYHFSFHAWSACLLLALSLNIWLEFHSEYLHARKQIDDLLSDLFAPGSSYSFEELDVPPALLDGFWSYQLKVVAARLFKMPGIKPVRVIRFQPSDEGKATNAALAFPIDSSSSLVFVRVRFEDLTDGQRFQLYHELAHGTLEGSLMMALGIRWKTLAAFGFPLFCAMSAMCFFSAHGWHRWLSIGLLMTASWLRRRGAKFTTQSNSTDNEIIADSIALAHPDFQANEKWKERADSLAKRLEDEAKLITASAPKYFTLIDRVDWLRNCLRQGRIFAKIPYEIGLLFLPAFLFYALSGYYARLPNAYAGITFWTLLVLVFLSWLWMLSNLLLKLSCLTRLHAAFDEHLKPKA